MGAFLEDPTARREKNCTNARLRPRAMTQPTNLKMTDSMVGRCAVFFCTTLLRMCTRMSESEY